MSKEVKVAKLPLCDICKQEGREEFANYDAKTMFGPWANMCEHHYKVYGPGQLGTGYGQRLVLA